MWTDEAREAAKQARIRSDSSAEAYAASDKAGESNSIKDHTDAALMHRGAGALYPKGSPQANEHIGQAALHEVAADSRRASSGAHNPSEHIGSEHNAP